jgi:hypothetical protein
MKQVTILYPILAMLLLVAVVMALMLKERVAEMNSRRIPLREVPSSSQMAVVLRNTRAADNYRNLFEMPVFFYALCLACYATAMVAPLFVYGAWLYVALRVWHSAIHIGRNPVMLRLKVFVASSVLLLFLWVCFAVLLWQRP